MPSNADKPQTTHVCYADSAWHGVAKVELNVQLARDTFRLRIVCPQIARRILPGQFVMVRLPGINDPLLGRPLALYDVIVDGGNPAAIDVVYLVVGKMTRLLARLKPGEMLELWGPLGNGFPPVQGGHLVMVAGGIGQTPFLALAKEHLGLQQYGDPPRVAPQAKKVTLCYGVRTADLLAGLDDFRRAGVEVFVSTDDGSLGHGGVVTDLIAPVVDSSPWPCCLVCCGPEPMLAAAAQIARQRHLPCLVSLESPMACGIGICFSCAVKIRQPSGGWDYRRSCVEGPVFRAEDVVFPTTG